MLEIIPKKDDKLYFLSILKDLAKGYDIKFPIIAGIIETESSWNTYAVRYEPRFAYIEDPLIYCKKNNISRITEKYMQMVSWGLGQVMGGTARTLKFTGPLVRLCEPEIGLDLACKVYKSKCDRYPAEDRCIASYNAGSPQYNDEGNFINQDYVDKVYANSIKYQNM